MVFHSGGIAPVLLSETRFAKHVEATSYAADAEGLAMATCLVDVHLVKRLLFRGSTLRDGKRRDAASGPCFSPQFRDLALTVCCKNCVHGIVSKHSVRCCDSASKERCIAASKVCIKDV